MPLNWGFKLFKVQEMVIFENNDVLGDNIGYIRLVGVMGSDLEIVNDARVSYNKTKSQLDIKDEKLIKFLIQHKHNSPMRGSVLKFEVKCPLFIARQWWKHHVASNYTDSQDGWNELSLRYVEGQEVYIPTYFRYQSVTNKQGGEEPVSPPKNSVLRTKYKEQVQLMLDNYHYFLSQGISREQARGLLPTCIYTRFRWTTSLDGILNFISLRNSDAAQWEIQQYAKSVYYATAQSFPVATKFFLEST